MLLTDYFNNVTKKAQPNELINPISILSNKLKHLLTSNEIDMEEYTTITDILKTKGLLSNAHAYFKFINKLKQNDDSTIVINNFKKIFSHIHLLMDHDKINKDILVVEIEKYNNNGFILTDDQRQASYDIVNFIYDPQSKKHGLCGLPGAGKTILITKLVHYLLGNKYIKSIVFAASTNKAVNVIKAKFRNDLDDLYQIITNKPKTDLLQNESFDDILDTLEKDGFKIHFLTIHKLLGYKNDYDSEGERIFVRGQNVSINKYELVIIDEISMINFNMVYNLFDENLTKGTKILFVGDEGQLPPVKEDISVIFATKEKDFKLALFEEAFANNKNIDRELLEAEIQRKFTYFKEQILSLKYSSLNTVMRCNSDSVVKLCNELRKKIFDNSYVPQFFSCRSNKVKFYKYDTTKSKINSTWFKKYTSYMKSINNDKCNSLILTWTNLQTNEYNNCMRKLLFNKEVLDKFEVGDILVMIDFYNIKDTNTYNPSNKSRFYSSEQIKITKIDHVTKVLPPFVENLVVQKNIDGLNDIKEKYVRTIKAINKLTNRNYNVWKLTVTKLSNIINSSNETYPIYVVDDTSIEIHKQDIKMASEKITELLNYYRGAHKEHYETIDTYIIRKLWKEFNNKFVDTFAKVNMSYAMTTHKSQGSTFYNVFVDMIDILKNHSKTDANRCLYTAISRTSNEVHILY
jgi:GTPase SAR1 family protein